MTTTQELRETLAIVGGRSHPELVRAICAHVGIPQTELQPITFKNGQFIVRLAESVRGKHVFIVQTTTPEHPTQDVVELILAIDAAERASAEKITLVLPYFPWVRSEKKNQPRVGIPASIFARIFEEVFPRVRAVVTLDLHVPAIQGFVKLPFDELWAAPLLASARGPLTGRTERLVATDAGAYNNLGGRYGQAFDTGEIATIQKRRTGHTEKTEPVGLAGSVEGLACLLFDDEIATGGTLVGDAQFLQLRNSGSPVSAFVTHGVLAGEAPELIAASPLTELWVTDSVPVPPEKIDRSGGKIKVVSCAPLLGEAIMRSARHQSLQPLLSTAVLNMVQEAVHKGELVPSAPWARVLRCPRCSSTEIDTHAGITDFAPDPSHGCYNCRTCRHSWLYGPRESGWR